VREEGTELVGRWVRSGIPATSRITEVEVASALARRWREGAFDLAERDRALAALAHDLEVITVVEVVAAVTSRARALLVRHTLRAADALQLASCLVLRDGAGTVAFAAFDDRLIAAAQAEGLQVLS
jgi:uncharacterized protein